MIDHSPELHSLSIRSAIGNAIRFAAVIATMIALSAGPARAQAFGVTPEIDPALLAPIEQLAPNIWRINPPSPNSHFVNYEVGIANRNICSVTGEARHGKMEDVVATANNIAAQLSDIYGLSDLKRSSGSTGLHLNEAIVREALRQNVKPDIKWTNPTDDLQSIVLTVERLWAEMPDTPVISASLSLSYFWGGEFACVGGQGVDATGL